MSFPHEETENGCKKADGAVQITPKQKREYSKADLELQVIFSTLKSIQITLLLILSSVAFLIGRVLAC